MVEPNKYINNVKIRTPTNNQRLLGTLRNIYETFKLTSELNSKFVKDASPANALIIYYYIVNNTT